MSFVTLRLETNVKRSDMRDKEGLLTRLSNVFAKELGGGRAAWEAVSIILVPDSLMIYRGSRDPCAVATFTTMGLFGGIDWKTSRAIYAILKECLGIPGDRCHMRFEQIKDIEGLHSDKDTISMTLLGNRYWEIHER